MGLKDAPDTAREQARGTARNAREVAGSTGVDDLMPAGFRGVISELLYLFPHALGRGTARQQLTSSVVLGLLAVLASPLTLTTSLYLLLPLTLTFGMGLWRLVPAVNSSWKGSRAQKVVGKDRDVPGWRRE